MESRPTAIGNAKQDSGRYDWSGSEMGSGDGNDSNRVKTMMDYIITPKTRRSSFQPRIPTSHLKLTRREKLENMWDNCKFVIMAYARSWRISLRLFTAILLSIGIAILAVAVYHEAMSKKNWQPIIEENGVERTEMMIMERYRQSFEEVITKIVDGRMENMIMDWRKEQTESVNTRKQVEEQLKKDLESVKMELDKQTAKLQSVFLDSVNASRQVVQETASVAERQSQLTEIQEQLKQEVEKLRSRLLDINEKFEESSSSMTLPKTYDSEYSNAFNMASRKHGAKVIQSLSSPTAADDPAEMSYFSHAYNFFKPPKQTHEHVITERMVLNAGDAWCFEGSIGYVTIRLWANASVLAVQYQHDHWYGKVPISAPREYQVLSCDDPSCTRQSWLGDCVYSLENVTVTQSCKFEKPSRPLDLVRFRFLSNHGQTYTCVYNLKIFGHVDASTLAEMTRVKREEQDSDGEI